ncbi:YSIRK-type signal peptide-containing protein [Staphylococcus simulans]|uniref:Staphylococcus aureus surface protein A n=2 Tax=Staphylococcus TaxID=1279 RepID=A0A6N3CJD3_STASI
MKKLDFLPNLRNRYSIRRFTVGTASILIGSLLFLGHSGEAKAAENINDNNTVVEASNDSSTTQQAPEENNKTSLEKTVDATQQQTDNKAQTQNALEEVKKQATTEITSLKNLNKEEVDSYTLEVQQADSESTVHAIVEKAKAAAQAVAQKEESIQTQKTENSKESTEATVEKTKETPTTEAEPVKAEATVEKASEPVAENKEEAPESVVTPATEPAVEKAVETVTETPVLSPEQKVEKVKADLSNDYDSAKVDAVLAVIDTTDLTPEQLKSEVLRLLLEEASAQKDLFSPQATLPRTGEEASGYSTRAFDLEEAASQEIVVTKENFGEYFKTLNDATYDSQSGVVTLTTNEANKSGAMSLDFKLNLTKDFSFSGAVNLGDKYEAHPKDGVTGGEGLAITFNPGKTYTLGLTGQGFGIGGESSSFGFKLDTFVNKANDDKSKAFSDTIQFENKGAFGAFIYTTDTGLVNTVIINPNASGNAALLKEQPNNQLVPFKFNYNGTTKVMTITYGTQTWTQNIQDYINYSRKDSFAFSIVASTTDHYNLQQIKLDEFRFTASAVLDEYFIDDDTEEAIDKPLRTAGDVNEKITLKDHAEYLAEKGYEFGPEKVRDEAHANGYDGIAETVILENDAQQLVYTVVDIQNPTIAEVTDVTTNVSEAITPITLDITDNSGHFDTIAVTGLPTGLSFNETTKQITGTPTTPGDATVEVTATDMAGNTTTKTFKISVAGAQAPTITPINAQTGEAYTPITPIAVNVEGDLNPAPTVAVTGLPAGLSFDAATKQITGTPTAEGTFNVTVTATQEASEPATSTFNITVQPNAALKDLKAAVADAATVNKDSYTPKSVEAYEAKVTAGGTLAGQPENGSNAQFTDASKAIKDAKNALVPRADKAALNQSITTAEALQPLEAGDPEDDALKTAIETAKTVQGDLNIDQPAVNKAKTDLDNAIAAKNLQDELDKENALDELKQTLEYAEAIDPAIFTTSSKKAFTEALTNAKTILGSPGSKTIAEIKAATNALEDAQNVLVPQADKTALKTAINTANGYNNLNPNNPVDKALQDKLAAANAVNTNGDATADQVKTATDDLNTAITAKKAQDDQIAKDAAAKKAALDALNDELNKVKALDKATYTPNTVTPLTEKQTAAQAIADAPDTKTTEEINAATKALKDAQNALVPKANKDDLNNSVKTAEALPLNPADTEDKAVQDAIDAAQTVNKDDNATPQQVADATKAINDAVATKAHQDALDQLNKALEDAAKIDKTDYTADSVKPFDTAVEAGKTAAGDNTSTVEALNNATKAVKDATAQLVPDKSKLDTAITEAKALEPLTDSNTDQLLKNVLNAAEAVKNNPNATPEEIKTATWNLEDEINNKKAADAIEALKSAVNKAEQLNEAKYTPNTYELLKTAMTEGQKIINNPPSADTPATLAKAKQIEELVNALKERADKTELGNALDKAIAYGDLNPNDAEDKALQDAVTAGQKVNGDGNATTEEVANAVKTINDAIATKERQDAVDELTKAINDAKAVNKDDYKPNTVTPFETAVTAGETAKDDATKTVEEIKAATKAITDAKNALDKKADKTELNTSVTTAENLGALDTKDAEDKAVQDALDKAKTVQADQNATQEAVNTAKTELDNAVNAKKDQDAKDAQAKQEALDALKAELDKVKAVDKTVYTPNTVTTLTEKETAGNDIVAAPEAKTTEEINQATQALKDAQNALVKKADKTELQKALDKANTFTDLAATDKEDKAVQDAVEAGNTVKADDNATVEQVEKATKAINDAVAAKERQDALDELNKAITDAKTVNKDDYKPNTVTPFETAVTAGETAKDDATKTVEELKAATKAITDAKNALDKKADKTELNTSVTTAENLGALDTNDKEDKAVQDAVTAGNTVNEDGNATTEQVANATKAINDAIAVKERQDALDELQKAIDDANTVKKDDYKPNTVTPFEAAVTAGETTKDDATKSVEEIKAATKAITDAKNALDKKADKTELNTSVTTAENLGALDTNDKEDKAVQDALDKAKTVQADQNATQEAVNTAKTELDNALNAKKAQDTKEAVEKQNALDALKAELEKAKTVNKELYTTNSVKVLTDSETAGQNVVDNAANKTTQEIEEATKALKDAQANLVSKADKTELVKALEKAKTLGDLVATDKEDKVVQDAVTAGEAVNEDHNVTQEQVANATKEINDAIAAKERQDALDVLTKAIKEANSVVKDEYKPNTVTPLEEAVKAGETARADATKTVEELKQAAQTITDAQNKLELKANKEELNKVVKTTETLELNPADKEDKAVQDALNTAKEVQADQNASQETVDKAKTDLENAVKAKTTQDKVDAFNKALDALKAELEKVKTIDKDFYTPNSVKPVTDAETTGQAIAKNSAGKTVEEINKATQDLKEAQKHLVEKADKVELDKVIDTAENTELNVNDKEDKAVQDALDKAIKVQEDFNATQEEVDKAQADLAKALETKATQDKADQVNAALEVLKKELEKVASIDKYAYTPNSVEPLTKAETTGQAIVKNSTGKTVEEINKATQDLKEAQKHLVEKADKVELDKVIDTAENTELNVNDKEDKAVQDALDKAIKVQEDFNATQEEVDKAQSDLAKALENKAAQDKVDQEKVQAFNKALEALKAQLASSRTVVKDNFTPNSVAPFEDAQAVAQGIVNNPESVTVEQVVKATEVLKSTQSSLVTKADKSELEKVIKTAEGLDLNVTDKEDKAVKEALDTAVTVEADQNATQESVNKATSELEKAIENKVTQDKVDAFNKALEALKAQLASSRTVVKDNFTPNSVAPFEEAQAVAQGIVNNPESVTVEQVVKATEVLKSTQSSLVTKADKSELEKVIKTAEGLDLNVTDKEDKAVKDALDTAVTVEADQNATQESVNKATSELEKAIENKVTQDKVDAFNKALEALKVQLASSRTVVKDNFTTNSVAPFEDAQAVAQGIVNNPESVTVEQVVKATEVLKSTQSSLVTKADKSELEKVIKTAEGLDLNVTDKEDKAVKDALDTAVTVEADQNATQESVDKAQSDLEKALETKAAQDKADAVAKAKADALAELEKALDKTETIDKSKYTPESVEKLDQAVVDGKVIVEKADNVSVQDIKEATKAVETALNGLEKVKAPAKETGKTTESTPGTAKSDTKSDVKAQDKQTSKATKDTKGTKAEKAGETKAKAENAGKNKAKALPETGQDVSSIDPQYASLMFAIGGLMMFFRKRKNEDKDNTEK